MLKAGEHAELIAGLLKDKDKRVRGSAANALVEFDATQEVKRIIELTRDPEASVREWVIKSLMKWKGKNIVNAVSARLDDPSSKVRMTAAWALETFNDSQCIKPLEQALKVESNKSAAQIIRATIRCLAEAKGDRKPVSIKAEYTGPESRISKTEYLRIMSKEDMKKLWTRHLGGDDAPVINFEQNMVIAIFKGKHWNSRGITANCTQDDETIKFRFDMNYYQTMGGGDEVTSYGLFVIPRSTKPVVLEEDTQGLIGYPPVWTEKGRFPELGR